MPVFAAKPAVWEMSGGKNPMIRMDGTQMPNFLKWARLKDRQKLLWIENSNLLTTESDRNEWIDALLKINNGTNKYHKTLLSKWTIWTSTKVILNNFGLGGIYDKFELFTTKEIKQHLGL